MTYNYSFTPFCLNAKVPASRITDIFSIQTLPRELAFISLLIYAEGHANLPGVITHACFVPGSVSFVPLGVLPEDLSLRSA